MKNKNILLTGTAGFIGSNFVPYFLEKVLGVINLETKLGWKADENFDTGIVKTVCGLVFS